MKIGTILFLIVLLVTAGLLIGALVALFNPNIASKAGSDWMWRLGKYDPIRNIFFRQDGTSRRYGKLVLSIAIIAALTFDLSVLLALIL